MSYKWSIDKLMIDIKKIRDISTSNNSHFKVFVNDDFKKISYLLEDVLDFDRPNRASHVYTIVNRFIDNSSVDKHLDLDCANKLQHLRHINLLNKNMLNNLSNTNLKKIKKIAKSKTNELEIIYHIRDMFNNFDKGLLTSFDEFINSKRINISENDYRNNDTFICTLKSIQKSYCNIRKCDDLSCIDDILYCFFKSTVYHVNSNRNTSIFNKTLENFFTLVTADSLKEKGYRDFYNLRMNLFNHVKSYLNDFYFIASNAQYLKYDTVKNNFVIESSSSLFDGELSAYYKKGVSYDTIIKPSINVYSYLLGQFLYNQYKNDKAKTVNDIHFLIKNIGVIDDEKLLNALNINIYNLYELSNCSKISDELHRSYKVLKRKQRLK